jgi:hypothetical protein
MSKSPYRRGQTIRQFRLPAVLRAVQTSHHGVDLLQAASNRLPALDQFPILVPEPLLSYSPPRSAVSFVVESHFGLPHFLGAALLTRPEQCLKIIDSLSIVTVGGPTFHWGFPYPRFRQVPGHQLAARKSLDVNEEGLVMAKTPADWSAAMPIFWQSDNWKTRNHASANALAFVAWRAPSKVSSGYRIV